MGATTGAWGTLRAQLHLRQVLAYLETYPLNRPEVLVTQARDKFDADGHLVDQATRTRVRELLVALRDWMRLAGVPARHAAGDPVGASLRPRDVHRAGDGDSTTGSVLRACS